MEVSGFKGASAVSEFHSSLLTSNSSLLYFDSGKNIQSKADSLS